MGKKPNMPGNGKIRRSIRLNAEVASAKKLSASLEDENSRLKRALDDSNGAIIGMYVRAQQAVEVLVGLRPLLAELALIDAQKYGDFVSKVDKCVEWGNVEHTAGELVAKLMGERQYDMPQPETAVQQ